MISETDRLIDWLARGEPHYSREESGTWSVCIFRPGTAEVLTTVASGMDKSVALWVQIQLKEALQRLRGQ